MKILFKIFIAYIFFLRSLIFGMDRTNTVKETEWQVKFSIEAHQKSINAVVISTDSKYIVSGGFDQQLKLWNLKTGKLIKNFFDMKEKRFFNEINAITISKDNKYVLSGDHNGCIIIWNFNTGKLLKNLYIQSSIHSISISNDNKYIIACSVNKIFIFNLDSGKLIHNITVTNSESNNLQNKCFFDINLMQILQTDDTIKAIDTSTNLKFIVYGTSEGKLVILKKEKIINKQDLTGMTQLMYAAINGNLDLTNQIIKAGANLDLQDSSGWTALIYAAYNNKYPIVNLLLKSGANPNLKPNIGLIKTAYEFALSNGHQETVKVFLKYDLSKQ